MKKMRTLLMAVAITAGIGGAVASTGYYQEYKSGKILWLR